MLAFDPAEHAPADIYKLMVGAIVPRPIALVSSIDEAGVRNLAPFSYFQLVNHDPPMFTLGFSIARGTPKDTLVQLLETGECTINIISEWFVEAANYTSINAPPGVSEWEMSGLTKGETVVVKAPRVKESVFAVEAKLVTHHEWTGKQSGKHTGTLAILEGVMFHVREDALDMSKGGVLDPAKLKAVSRLGGVTFGRTESGFELTRPEYNKEKEKEEFQEAVGGKPTDERL